MQLRATTIVLHRAAMAMDESLLLGIVALLICLFLTIFGLLAYSGLFYTIYVRAGRPPVSGVHIAYKFARGPYKNAGSIFTEVHSYTPTLKSIGLYYDDPSEVAQCDLRYVVGAIISEGDSNDDTNIEYANLLVQKGYKLTKLPSVSHAVTTTFPFKNTLSIFLAVARVYPRLTEYIKERKLCAHPMIEVYDDDVIHFVAPLAKQDEFYVSEANEDHSDEENISSETPMQPANESSAETSEVEPKVESQIHSKKEGKKEGSNGSGDDSTGSSFEELNVDSESK